MNRESKIRLAQGGRECNRNVGAHLKACFYRDGPNRDWNTFSGYLRSHQDDIDIRRILPWAGLFLATSIGISYSLERDFVLCIQIEFRIHLWTVNRCKSVGKICPTQRFHIDGHLAGVRHARHNERVGKWGQPRQLSPLAPR